MRAIWITRHGGPEVLEVRETADPKPGAGQVRVRVCAAGLNFAEVMARQGLYPDAPKPPCVLGYETAGVVDALGPGVASPVVGQRVAALVRFGAHAEAVCVPAEQTMNLPEGASFEEAAALPVNYLTAYHMLFRVAGIRAGERVLVHMAAGGVGIAVLQLCRTVDGVVTFGTASAAKHEVLRAEGCTYPIDYRRVDYAAEVRRLTGGEGVDVVLDPLGGHDWKRGLALLRPVGRLVAFGFANLTSGERRRPLRVASQALRVPVVTPLGLMARNRTISGVNIGAPVGRTRVAARGAGGSGRLVAGGSPQAAGALVNVGDHVSVSGRVLEFRPGGATGTDNLTTTEITTPGLTVAVLSSGNPLPAPTVVGVGGRVPPSMVIEDDATGSVETSGIFDPAADGIDFYESLEGMRVQVNQALAVGPRNGFGEIPVVGDQSQLAGVDSVRGGVLVRPSDFNPERIILDDTLLPTPVVNVGDGFTTPVVGVIDYSFGNFKLNITGPLARVDGGLQREVTRAPRDQELVVGTYNVENLDPGDGGAFTRHAQLIVDHLRSPDLLAIEEIQDNDGPTNSSVTDASVTWGLLVDAIRAVGGPEYQYRQLDPVDDQDGGEPGGNIRVGFLFRSDRGLSFVDRPGGTSTTATTVVDHPAGPRLSFSPGRVAPQDPAFVDTRKSLAGEFRLHGKTVFVVANHFSSKTADDPLFGRWQPPIRASELARHAQAQVVNDFVDQLVAADPQANVIVLGDINDFEFSQTVQLLEGGVLTTLMDTLPKAERYSYVFEGNSQVLDQILVSNPLLRSFPVDYDPVHVNAEFADQASDHDPQVARLDLRGRPSPS